MSLAAIRAAYGVPAYRGTAIIYSGKTSGPVHGHICSASGDYLQIHYEGESRLKRHTHHATWKLEYLPSDIDPSDPVALTRSRRGHRGGSPQEATAT